MDFVTLYLIAGATILVMMLALWLVSLALKNSSIVDIFWGTGFVIVNALALMLAPNTAPARQWLLSALVTIWGLRLSLHILLRNAGKPEDFRYAAWRKQAGAAWWWYSFFKVFLLQGVLMWIIATPLVAAQTGASPRDVGWLDFLALAVWAYGFFFEAVGDWQLAQFKKNPANKGKLLTTGVWRYTRHPNYFGDAAQWWGFYLIALAAGAWWTIFAPIIMTLLLMRVSGVTLLEKTLKETKPGYKEYVETTSEFIPWFPRSAK